MSITELKKNVGPILRASGCAEEYLSDYGNNMQTISKKTTRKRPHSIQFTELTQK